MIKRAIEPHIAEDFKRGKVITILGPRQVGKTTLLTQLNTSGKRVLFLNCDDELDALTVDRDIINLLAERVKQYRLAARMSQRELAEKSGVGYPQPRLPRFFCTAIYSQVRTYADRYTDGSNPWGNHYKYGQYILGNIFYNISTIA